MTEEDVVLSSRRSIEQLLALSPREVLNYSVVDTESAPASGFQGSLQQMIESEIAFVWHLVAFHYQRPERYESAVRLLTESIRRIRDLETSVNVRHAPEVERIANVYTILMASFDFLTP